MGLIWEVEGALHPSLSHLGHVPLLGCLGGVVLPGTLLAWGGPSELKAAVGALEEGGRKERSPALQASSACPAVCSH